MSAYCELKDFDWSARVVLASDKISGLRSPLVILKLFLKKQNGDIEEQSIELSSAELSRFLGTLNSAKQKIADLKTDSK
jgi:hypothetical protein